MKKYTCKEIFTALGGQGIEPDLMAYTNWRRNVAAAVNIVNMHNIERIGANYCHRIHSNNLRKVMDEESSMLMELVSERLDVCGIEHEISRDEDNYLIIYVAAKEVS